MDSMFLVEVPGHLEDALVEGLEVLEEAGREICEAELGQRYKGVRRGILTDATLGARGAFVDDSRRASGGGAIVLRGSHGDGLRMSISELGQKKYNA